VELREQGKLHYKQMLDGGWRGEVCQITSESNKSGGIWEVSAYRIVSPESRGSCTINKFWVVSGEARSARTPLNTGGKGSFTLWVHGGFMVGFE
jgi:hypothetical protein